MRFRSGEVARLTWGRGIGDPAVFLIGKSAFAQVK
jgi:hypothetical protein